MPTLPRYYSQEQPTNPPGLAIPRAAGGGEQIEATEKLAETIQNVSLKWAEAIDTMQYTTAKANFEVGMTEIENRAALDPDFNNSKTYFKEIEDLRTKSLEGFSNRAMKDRAALEFDYGSRIGILKVDNIFKKKIIENNRFELDRGVEALLQKQINDFTPETKKQSLIDLNNLITLNVQNGTISREDGQEKLYNAYKSITQYDIYNDPATQEKDSLVLAELRKGQKGKYDFLTLDDQIDMIKLSQSRIFQNNQSFTRNLEATQTTNQVKFVRDWIQNQELKPNELENAVLNQEVSPDFASAFKDAVTSTKVFSPTPTAQTFVEILDAFLDDKKKTSELITEVTRRFSEGKLDMDEYGYFMDEAEKRLRKTQEGKNWEERNDLFKNSIETIKKIGERIFTDNPIVHIASMIKMFIDKTKNNPNSNSAIKQVIQEQIKQNNPEVNTFPAEGQLMIDAQGHKAIVFPDGSYKEVE